MAASVRSHKSQQNNKNPLSLPIAAGVDAFEYVDEVFALHSSDTTISYISKNCERILGYTPEEMKGQLPYAGVHPDDLNHLWELFAPISYALNPLVVQARLRMKNSAYRWFQITVYTFKTDANRTKFYLSIAKDISKEKELENALDKSNSIFRIFSQTSPCAIFMANSDGNCVYVNEKWSNITSCRVYEALGKGWLKHIHSDDKKKVEKSWNDAVAAKTVFQSRFRYFINHKSIWVDMEIMPMKDALDHIVRFVGTIIDVSDQVHMKAVMERQAFYDHLTELPNRRLIEDRMHNLFSQVTRQNRRFAVLYLDIDNFKDMNDQYGHKVGDEMLKAVGLRLRKAIRKEDSAGRLGGDEFVILLAETKDEMSALLTAKKISSMVCRAVKIDGLNIKPYCSIGVAIYPDHGRNIATLLRHADQALYSAKEKGKNRIELFKSLKLNFHVKR